MSLEALPEELDQLDQGGSYPHCDEPVAINDLTTNKEENLGH